MLSVFPYLLSLSFVAVALLRVGLGLLSIVEGGLSLRSKINSNKVEAGLSAFQIVSAIFVLVGYLTQPAAIILSVVLAVRIFLNTKNKNIYQTMFYMVLILISLSLLALGPGPFAFDLPF